MKPDQVVDPAVQIRLQRMKEIQYDHYEFRGQVSNVLNDLINNWYAVQGYKVGMIPRPRLVVTMFDNRSDTYIPEETSNRIFREVAEESGTFTLVSGHNLNDFARKQWLQEMIYDPNYSSSSRPVPGHNDQVQMEVRITLLKVTRMGSDANYEDFEMTAAMYDFRTHQVIDCRTDILEAKVDYAL